MLGRLRCFLWSCFRLLSFEVLLEASFANDRAPPEQEGLVSGEKRIWFAWFVERGAAECETSTRRSHPEWLRHQYDAMTNLKTQTRQGRLGRVVWHAASAAMLGSRRVQFLATRSRSEPRRADLGSQPEVDCGRRLCSVCRSRRFLNPTAEPRSHCEWLRPFGPPKIGSPEAIANGSGHSDHLKSDRSMEIGCRGVDIFGGLGSENRLKVVNTVLDE